MSVVKYRGVVGKGLGNVSQVLSLASRMDPAVQAAVAQSKKDQKDAEENGRREAEQLEDTVKKESIKTAVAQAGVTMALNFFPIVGPILSLAAGEILGGHAKRYAAKLKEYGEHRMKELQEYVERRQREMDAALSAAYKKAYKRAVPLALSFQPLEFTESEREETINEEMFGNAFGGLGFIKKLTGKDVYEKGKAKIDATIKRIRGEIDSMVDPVLYKIKQPGFLAILTKTLAVEVRNNPTFLKLARQLGAPLPSAYMGQSTKQSTGSVPVAQRQTTPLQSGGGTGRLMQAQGTQSIATTSDQKQFYSPSKEIDEATKAPKTIRNVALFGGLALGAFLLLR